ncbi:helix-turn-helix transcriptional regulator [Paradevosia shaoguanensis]|uniref:helix-turn-helix transcriptional regulator n=1 Tax=Paradevosia shaoguanensis TaxID=1335043 RepID=UPI003C75204E
MPATGLESKLTLAELQRARKIAACIVDGFGSTYLPIFRLLDDAVEDRQAHLALLQKAKDLARSDSTQDRAMAEKKADIGARLSIRRALGQAEAALYVGLGTSKFAALVKDGRMPRPRVLDGRRLWDVDDLDAAFRDLPYEDTPPAHNPWDDE